MLEDLQKGLQFWIDTTNAPFKKCVTVTSATVTKVSDLLNFIEEYNIPHNATVSGDTEYEEYEYERGGCGTGTINFEWEVPHSEMSNLDKIKVFGHAYRGMVKEFERVLGLFQKFGYDTSEMKYPNRVIDIELLDKDLESFIKYVDETILSLEKEEDEPEECPY